jgi:hypothetical protein
VLHGAGGAPSPQRVPLPPGTLPSLHAPYLAGAGVTLELWLTGCGRAVAGQTLAATAPERRLALVAARPPPGPAALNPAPLQLQLADASTPPRRFNFTLDGTCTLRLASSAQGAGQARQLAVVIDSGPGLVLVVVDGVLCDGGYAQLRGWSWLPPQLGDLSAGVEALEAGGARYEGAAVAGGRVYGRALRVSELVGNFRAGPPGAADAGEL